ncbi:MAG TPA: NOP5/NOP56 family protein [Thermoplasmata archaeon]|nr:NOP5/NOP56 family protein [Thermoplasmata archaeon]
MTHVVTTWFGAFLVEGRSVVGAYPSPTDPAALLERLELRRAGRLTPEEARLLEEHATERMTTRDRRLVPFGPRFDAVPEPAFPPEEHGLAPGLLRTLLLASAQAELGRGWDPSLSIIEASRALEELEDVENRLEERLESWTDRPSAPADSDPTGTGHRPQGLDGARASLEAVRDEVQRTHREIARQLESALPQTAPNLCALLGPKLAARMISQAGGLDRLARMPASTVQVLGAEKAFFEHLRGRAPPPRHGLIFLHPSLHSAPRAQRGRMARALAGKLAIAARMDRAGAPVRDDLRQRFEKRVEAIRASPPRRPVGERRRSRPPLHRAAEHR